MMNENKIDTRPCPVCGIKRPQDWFGGEAKHVACWKCRALKRDAQTRNAKAVRSDDDLLG